MPFVSHKNKTSKRTNKFQFSREPLTMLYSTWRQMASDLQVEWTKKRMSAMWSIIVYYFCVFCDVLCCFPYNLQTFLRIFLFHFFEKIPQFLIKRRRLYSRNICKFLNCLKHKSFNFIDLWNCINYNFVKCFRFVF